MIKTTGAEWNKFYSDPKYWGNDTWHDDTVITVEGVVVEEYEKLENTAKVTIEGGYVVIDGNGPDEKSPSMETYFRRWKTEQTTIFLSVECPREKYEEVTTAIKSSGGKIKS